MWREQAFHYSQILLFLMKPIGFIWFLDIVKVYSHK